jgi:hypothetical protein
VLLGEFQNRERHPDFVVQVARVFERYQAFGETFAVSSLVEDLPTLPVMPITLMSN